MESLTEYLRHECKAQGALPFVRFMELALDHPAWGYYQRDPGVIGRRGDFFTSVSTGPLFGRLLGFQLAGWLQEWPEGSLQLVELGPHEGRLARDILAWMQQRRPAVFERLEYWLVDPSPRRRHWQAETLASFADKVRWLDSLAEAAPRSVRGTVFSNEFFDALPVHRLGWDPAVRRWFEWGVAWEGGRFAWAPLPGLPTAVQEIWAEAGGEVLDALGSNLPSGFTVEFCPNASRWWSAAARALQAGRVLALDYGHEASELFRAERTSGTLRAYGRHRLASDVLASPGELDLTAHVNWTQLQTVGRQAGLATETFAVQEVFLVDILRRAWPELEAAGGMSAAERRQLRTLTHPQSLGRAFQALVQRRR